MKKVYSSDNLIQSGYIKGLLEAHGISCHLRNIDLAGGIGGLPINECWPEVWLVHDDDYRQANTIINEAIK